MDRAALFEEFNRAMDDWDREKERIGEMEAKEKGFSSYEEYEKHLMEEWRLRDIEYERQMDEKAALLGKTRHELYMEDPQRYIPNDGGMGECDCEGEHPMIF